MTPAELAIKWRSDARLLDQYGDAQLARVCVQHADALDAAMRSVADDALDLATAARESGYSPDRLRHMVADGKLPNVGKKGAPRIRRGDLPLKPKAGNGRFDAQAAARSFLKVSSNA